MKRLLMISCLILIAVVVPWQTSLAQDSPSANLTDSCVENYDPDMDYFPEKATIEYAQGFEVEYFNHYKIVRSTLPFSDELIEYVLVQCGTPIPDDYPDAQVIEVPVTETITLSTTQLPHLAEMNLIDSLVGIGSADFINTSEVIALAEEGELLEVGFDDNLDIEHTLDAEADVVFTDGYSDVYLTLIELDVFTALNTEWVETSPLARAEWIKFTALFYNMEAAASEFFATTAENYSELVELTAGHPESEKPRVLYGTYLSWTEAWNLPGSDSHIAQLFTDAGGRIVLGNDDDLEGSTRSVPFSFEVVFDAGYEADIWITDAFAVNTLSDLLAQNELYEEMNPVQTGEVYNTNARQNESGGSDYYESAVIYPDVVLADLISIFHPDLLPDHERVYLKRLQ